MQNTHVYSFPFDFAKSRKMLFKPKLKHLNAYPVIPIDAKTQNKTQAEIEINKSSCRYLFTSELIVRLFQLIQVVP